MQHLIKYIIVCSLLVMVGCIKKEAAPLPPYDAGSASLRDLLANNFSFSMFYEAMQKTGIDTLLDNNSNGYTIFAPDNGAFNRSGITADSLRRIDPELLRKTILYHIIPGKVNSTGIPQTINYSFTTLEKDFLYTSTTSIDTNLFVNGIPVIRKNISGRNGVIHAMDRALTLPASSVQEILSADPEFSYLVAGFKKFGFWDGLKTAKPLVVLAPKNQAFAYYNWDLDAINQMNVVEFRKLVFGSYILKPAFFFLNDIRIAPPAGPFLQEDVLLSITRANTGEGIRTKVLPYNYRDGEMSSRNIFYGDWVNYPYTEPGKLAANGIVHPTIQLGVIPDSARIK